MIVRLGSLLTIPLVIVVVLIGFRESCLPRNTQLSPAVLETEFQALPGDATGSHPIARTSQSRRDDDVGDAVDVYGNEVDAAVATYKLDRTGALYEMHSPQTEVPQLPPPKS